MLIGAQALSIYISYIYIVVCSARELHAFIKWRAAGGDLFMPASAGSRKREESSLQQRRGIVWKVYISGNCGGAAAFFFEGIKRPSGF